MEEEREGEVRKREGVIYRKGKDGIGEGKWELGGEGGRGKGGR